MSRRILQLILAVIGLIAVVTGGLGIISGITTDYGDFYHVDVNNSIDGNIILDSNLRYYSGLWFGLGLILFLIVPTIERQKLMFRLISGMIFIGGLGRLISILAFGVPSPVFVIFALLELFFPLLILWQNKIPQPERLN